MKGLAAFVALLAALTLVTVARGGHELAIYPSYYPHEIQIETVSPREAAGLLRGSKIQAFVGPDSGFIAAVPDSIRAVESLGSFVIVRVNPKSSLARDEASACAVARTVVRDIAGKGADFILHPYPVTPFHGDYLHHSDLAAAAKTRLSGGAHSPLRASRSLKVRARGELATRLVRRDGSTHDADWDAEVEDIDAASLVAAATVTMNGWIGPPWARTGWFQAALLLADSANDPERQGRVEAGLRRLEARAYGDEIERINLERDVVSLLAGGCHKMVAGYTVRREYISVDYYAGIENIAYDSLEGLSSPMFIRTVKLKDFPWNGWLALGIDAKPTAAWNPIGGFTDGFGRLMWFALGDPALIPSPYDGRWMLNRISDVQSDSSP
jgi:hypothetical protein